MGTRVDRQTLGPRCVAVVIASVLVEVVLLRAAVPATLAADAPTLAAEQRIGAALTAGVLIAALAAWTWWCGSVLLALRLGRTSSVRARTTGRGSRWVRVAALTLGIGTIGLTAAAPASADPGGARQPSCEPLEAARLDGLTLPVLPSAPRHSPAAATTLVVGRGDSLWSLATSHLDPPSPATAVDRLWRRWYAANRDVIGPDPDLLQPGQRLRVSPPPPTDQRNRP